MQNSKQKRRTVNKCALAQRLSHWRVKPHAEGLGIQFLARAQT